VGNIGKSVLQRLDLRPLDLTVAPPEAEPLDLETVEPEPAPENVPAR
jgi:hypothetical protein